VATKGALLRHRVAPGYEASAVLKVEGLVKRFGGFTALSNVSFKIAAGEIVGLIGPNGSGKSTIFNVLSGNLVPTGGTIEFLGRQIAGLPAYRIINAGIGRTFQIPRPFKRLSLFENVAVAGYYGQGQVSRTKALRASRSSSSPRHLPPVRSCCWPTNASADWTRPR
jgi:branched-chain amino acid transport system ATP-binding protein